MSWSCPRCGDTTYPGFVMNDAAKMQAQCHKCGAVDPMTTPQTMNVGIAAVSEGENLGPGWAGKRQEIVTPGLSMHEPVAAPVIRKPSVISSPVISRTANVTERIAALAAEESQLERTIAESRARLAGVRAERKTLARLQPKSEKN